MNFKVYLATSLVILLLGLLGLYFGLNHQGHSNVPTMQHHMENHGQ
jgi:hypothetical protein